MKKTHYKIVISIVIIFSVFDLSVNAQIYSTSAGGPWDSTWTWVGNVVPTDAYNVVVNGAVHSSNNACHNLTIGSNGSLYNSTYSYALTVSGDLTNNGLIQSQSNSYYLTINVNGDVYNNATIQNKVNLNISGQIINDGIWDNFNTALTGGANQNFTCNNGHSFSSTNFYNNKTGGDINIDNLVYFDGVQINFNNHDFPISENTTLKIHDGRLLNCNLIGEGELSILLGEGTYNADAPEYENVSFTDLALHGENNIVNSNCSSHGRVVNNGSLQNYTYAGTLNIYDDFVNNGIIKDISNSYPFTIKLYGDFYNNGSLTNEYFYPYSDSDQSISGLNGNPYSPVNFKSYKPSGKMIMATDIEFQNCIINMQGDTLYAQNDILTHINGGRMQNTPLKAYGTNSIHNRLFMENNAYLENCHIYNPEILGEVLTRNNNFYGDILVTDTLQNNNHSYTLTVSGDLTNNGLIQSQSSSYSLNLNVNGDVHNNANILNFVILNIYSNLTNNGIMDNYRIQMIGANEQYVHLQNGNYISGQMRFVSDINTSPFQWYWNNWAIQNPPYPDPAIFSGQTSNTLAFLNDVGQNRLGTYYCSTGGGNSRNIIVDEIFVSSQLDIHAFLEGPFNGTNMNSDMNSIIPLQQPYNVYPWEYDGTESVPFIPNANVVDWLLVEFRDAPDAASATSVTSIGGQAAFILNNGSIVDLDGSSLLAFDYTLVDELFVVLWHRNHLPAMSAVPVSRLGDNYTFNFSTASSQAYGDNQNNLGGYYGMIGGDANGDGTINETDGIEAWYPFAGQTGYYGGDVNMDTQVNNQDKNDIWLPNYNKSEILP